MAIQTLKRSRWNSLWALRHGLLNLLNLVELLVELPLAVPYCGMCLIFDLLAHPKRVVPAHSAVHG